MRSIDFTKRRTTAWLGALGASLALLSSPAQAQQTWPAKPLSIVVGFAAGGPTDILARVIAKSLGEELGQSVIVENKPGAGATVAAAQVAQAAPDGYTMLLVFPGLTGAENLFPNRKYDLARDFAPISQIGSSPNWLLTPTKSDFKTMQDVARLASTKSNKYAYAHGGTGGISHLTSELLNASKNLEILQVPYRGNGPALVDLVAGRIDLMFDQPISSESFVTSGQLRPLAVTSPKRLPAYPNVPTMEEAGYADFVVEVWYGLVYPARTPVELVQKVNAALARVLVKSEIQASLQRSGITPQGSTPQELQTRIKNEVARWGKVIQKAGIKAE